MAINYLVTDIFDYIFNKTDITNIVICTRVCRLWYDCIMQKSIKCDKCNKIISLYGDDIYVTDAYCLMCHGRLLNAVKYEILNYKIQNIKIFQTIINFLSEGDLHMSIDRNSMKLKQRNFSIARSIIIEMLPIQLAIYTHDANQIDLHISNTQLCQLINSDYIHTSEISVYNENDEKAIYLK